MDYRRRMYEFLSFIRHLPSYFRLHVRNVARSYASGHPGNALFLDRERYIISPPSSSVTHAVWIQHSTFDDGHREDAVFRRLRAGCANFLDLGAAEGYYSALFAVTADRPSRVVAVDLAPEMCRLHEEVILANSGLSGQPLDWTIHQAAITDRDGRTTLGDGLGLTCWYDKDPSRPVETFTLQGFIDRVGLNPDLVKIDIESFEYEVVTSSIDWFARHRPRLHLELHSRMMRERGKSPEELMNRLLQHYRIIGSVPSDHRTAAIARFGLVPRPA